MEELMTCYSLETIQYLERLDEIYPDSSAIWRCKTKCLQTMLVTRVS